MILVRGPERSVVRVQVSAARTALLGHVVEGSQDPGGVVDEKPQSVVLDRDLSELPQPLVAASVVRPFGGRRFALAFALGAGRPPRCSAFPLVPPDPRVTGFRKKGTGASSMRAMTSDISISGANDPSA